MIRTPAQHQTDPAIQAGQAVHAIPDAQVSITPRRKTLGGIIDRVMARDRFLASDLFHKDADRLVRESEVA